MIEDSDSMHACMADTTPPIIYMNDTTRAIHKVVREINEAAGRNIVGYTVDAGANCFLISEMEHLGPLTSGF